MVYYKAGQRVKVEYEGTVAFAFSDGRHIGIYQDGAVGTGSGTQVLVKTAIVTLLDPPDWPPRVGDIWEAQGQEYYVRRKFARMDGYAIESFTSAERWIGETLDEFRAISPKLLRRRGQ
jgi:hypothetical protein